MSNQSGPTIRLMSCQWNFRGTRGTRGEARCPTEFHRLSVGLQPSKPILDRSCAAKLSSPDTFPRDFRENRHGKWMEHGQIYGPIYGWSSETRSSKSWDLNQRHLTVIVAPCSTPKPHSVVIIVLQGFLWFIRFHVPQCSTLDLPSIEGQTARMPNLEHQAIAEGS